MAKEPTGELRVTFALPKEVEAELTAPPPAPVAAAGAPNLLYVTIESGRGLLAMDRNNSSDPFVKLSISKQKHQTATIEKTLKPHWDEKFAFLLADPMQTLDVLVEDEDRTINDFLGRAQVVLADVLQPHVERELSVKLMDKKLREDKDRGTIQLRLRWIYEPDADVMLSSRKRISVRTKHAKSVLQSDDESDEDFADDDVIDDESDDEDQAAAAASDLTFLVATIHRAEDLPPLDTVLFETEKSTRKHHGGGIDVYVGASLAQRPEEFVRTRIHAKKGRRDELRSSFHENLMLVLPKDESVSDVTLSVMDWDPLNNDDLVARVELPNVQALAAQTAGKPFWLNLYGAPVKGVSDKSVANRMNEQQSAASTYRGRVLLTLKVVGKSSSAYEAKPQKRIARKLPRELFPASSVYRMRAHFISGIGLPKGKFSLALSCGLHEIASTRKPAVNGSIDWNETEGSDKMLFPAEARQIPDVFLYLYKGEDEKRRVVCFKRFTATQLLAATTATTGVQWVTLAADRSMDVVDADATFAGKVLVRLGLSAGGGFESWDQRDMFDQVNRRIPYQVRVRVLEARKLVTGKAGSKPEDLAAGVTVQCWDELRRSKKEQKRTSNPLFGETFCIDVNLPKREFVPQVLLHVKNQTGNQEYIGTAAFDVATDGVVCTSQQIKQDNAQVPEPKWLPIVAETLEGEVERGQILASVQIIQKQFPDETFPEPEPLNVQSTQI